MDNCCSLGPADTEGDVAGDGLRPGRLCVSRGMGPWRDDHHPTAGPAGHGRLCKSASLSSESSCLSEASGSMWKLTSIYKALASAPTSAMDTP